MSKNTSENGDVGREESKEAQRGRYCRINSVFSQVSNPHGIRKIILVYDRPQSAIRQSEIKTVGPYCLKLGEQDLLPLRSSLKAAKLEENLYSVSVKENSKGNPFLTPRSLRNEVFSSCFYQRISDYILTMSDKCWSQLSSEDSCRSPIGYSHRKRCWQHQWHSGKGDRYICMEIWLT